MIELIIFIGLATDTAFEELLALGMLHKAKDTFAVSAELALSADGSKWFNQVSYDPVFYEFTDIALQHISNSTKRVEGH